MYILFLYIFPLDPPLLDLSDCLSTARLPLQENTLSLEDWELSASTIIARYGIESSNSECSPSLLYTAPNTPSSSQLHPIVMDENLTQMASDAEDRISRLKSRLSAVREQ